MRASVLLLALAGCVASAPKPGPPPVAQVSQPAAPSPPAAKKTPKVRTLHGEQRVDDYFWLRNKGSPEVVAYLKAENAYTDALMKPTEPFQELLYQEMLARIQETDATVPYREGEWLYYTRTEKGKQYPIYCRKKKTIDAPESVMLDLNEMAKNEEFLALGVFAASDDGNRIAYSTDNTGFRIYTLHVKDLRNAELGPEAIPRDDSVAWSRDGKTLFYVTEDDAKRPYRLYRHDLRQPSATDPLLYEEKDEMFTVEVDRSRSKQYPFLTSLSHTASEVRYLRADQPKGAFRLIAPREKNHEYYASDRGREFFIRTNSGGRNFRIVTAPVANPSPKILTEIVPHRTEVMLEQLEMFSDYYALFEREDGLPRIRITDFKTKKSHQVQFPEPVYFLSPAPNREFKTDKLRFSYQSFVTPISVYDYDIQDRKSVV